MNWGTVPDWISAFATAAMAIAAYGALSSWREQLKGTTKHAAALELATAARTLKYHFFEARSSFIAAWEFPSSYIEQLPGPSPEVKYQGYRHVFQNRWNDLWPHILGIAKLLPKMGAVLGDDVANDAESLVRVARRLRLYMDSVLRKMRTNPEAVEYWTDQDPVAVAMAGVHAADSSDDQYSQEFDAALGKLLEHLKPYLS